MKTLLLSFTSCIFILNVHTQNKSSHTPDSIESGFYSVTTGKIKTEGYFENYLKTGNWVTYFQTGQINKIEHYNVGKRNGIYVVINRRGYIEEQSNYLNNELDGRKTENVDIRGCP